MQSFVKLTLLRHKVTEPDQTHVVEEKVKRYFTQRNMNRKIHYYGMSGPQVILLAVIGFLIWMIFGNWAPAFLLVLVPIINLNKRKLSEGDPSYIDTVSVRSRTSSHYQDQDRVMKKLSKRWGKG